MNSDKYHLLMRFRYQNLIEMNIFRQKKYFLCFLFLFYFYALKLIVEIGLSLSSKFLINYMFHEYCSYEFD